MTSGPAGHPARATVLLVDDEEGVRSDCRRVLEGEGAHVVEAGEAATVAHLQSRQVLDRVDLVAVAIEVRRLNGRRTK